MVQIETGGQQRSPSKAWWPGLLAVCAAAVLSACGGGGGGGGGVTPPPTATVLTGTAAIGAALVGGQVTITDRNGAAACEDSSSLTTGAAGDYTCVLKNSAQAPFVIVVVDPTGLISPMVSLATNRPADGATSTANVSRLTTAIAAQLAPNKDPFAFVNDSSVLAALNADTLQAVKANLVTQLAEVLAALGIDTATFDPITTPFVGGSNTGADALLDQVVVRFENGAPTLSNVLNPDAAPVAMADATTTAPPKMSKATVTGFSVTELDFAKAGLEACFAVPSTSRIGHDACQDVVVDDAPVELTGGATYLHNGFDSNTSFGSLLGSSDMDGAKFNRPELLRYVKVDGVHDEAVINIKFTDKDGKPDNRILVVKKFPGTRAESRGTDWWVYGNQRPMNIHVRTSLRRYEQMAPEQFGAGVPRFQTGLEIFIAKPCDDQVRQCPNTDRGDAANEVRYVRVKGPGLPTDGLVYANTPLNQAWMPILNATGEIPDPADPQVFVNNSNNIFWLQRSKGISGASAFEVSPNPFVGSPTPSTASWGNSWAHPSMYDEPASSTWSFDLSKVPAWSEYTFEVFRGTQTTTTEILKTRTVTPVVPASYAATQQWHVITPATKALASDGAPAASSLDLAWTINPYAERIESVQVYSGSMAGPVNSVSTGVAKGASSRTVVPSNSSAQFPALSTGTNPLTSSRFLQFRYKMVDGSYRDMGALFN